MEGGHVEIAQISDVATVNKLNNEYNLLRRDAPIGNKEHPIMKRLDEISQLLKEVPKKAEYRLFYNDKGTFVNITKTEYDYAKNKAKQTDVPSAQPEIAKELPVETKPYPLRISGLTDVVEGEYKGSSFHTDGNMIILSKPKVKPKSIKDITALQKANLQNEVGVFLTPKEELHTVNKITFEDIRDNIVSNDPIKKRDKNSRINTRLNADNISTMIDQDYYNYIKKHYPDAIFKVSKDPESVVLVYSKDEVVGGVMSLEFLD